MALKDIPMMSLSLSPKSRQKYWFYVWSPFSNATCCHRNSLIQQQDQVGLRALDKWSQAPGRSSVSLASSRGHSRPLPDLGPDLLILHGHLHNGLSPRTVCVVERVWPPDHTDLALTPLLPSTPWVQCGVWILYFSEPVFYKIRWDVLVRNAVTVNFDAFVENM